MTPDLSYDYLEGERQKCEDNKWDEQKKEKKEDEEEEEKYSYRSTSPTRSAYAPVRSAIFC